ncbi:hypothetical protein [Formosa algae]|uniref:Glutaminyl-tRNA synthetase n=1 Tax=Formosa algae TaxID=225843 RepID=A0A9X0YPD3_9FLAO|nr:hypothetical protein [Formosa algae]MBP1841603.1 hypothetical protein [Formosa algae]MDQ0337004.1 hypothetical protein [Formosa algae]OEI80228.1 hypothetical protein AST99_10600 [Formosa algae]PNW26547.1 hypothetical protein BKP44_16595 [Formosa algae]
MRKEFTNFDEIKLELKRLDLERQIALEEFKALKGNVKEDLKPLNWVHTAINYTGKIGSLVFLKKLFK